MNMNTLTPSKLNQRLSELIKSWTYPSKSGINPYINFNKLVLFLVTWKTHKEFTEERNILKWEKNVDYLCKKEKERIPEIENRIITLLDQNLKYPEIKTLLTK